MVVMVACTNTLRGLRSFGFVCCLFAAGGAALADVILRIHAGSLTSYLAGKTNVPASPSGPGGSGLPKKKERSTMKLNLKSLAIVAVPAITVPAVLPLLGAGQTVPLGQIKCDGGTESVTVDSSAFIGGGGSATAVSGTFVNEVPGGLTFNDMRISIKKKGTAGSAPEADNVEADGQNTVADPLPSGDGEGCTVTNISVGGNGTANFGITNIDANATSEMTINLTPSFLVDVADVSREANATDGYLFSVTSNSLRNGVAELDHDTVAASIRNSSSTASITQLSGQVILPGGSSADLLDVYLQNAQGDYAGVEGASVTIDDLEFTVTNFTPLSRTGHYRLVVVLSSSLNGGTFQLDLTATFN